MGEHIYAPWAPDQVTALNRFQRAGQFHPFTCGGSHGHHVNLLATVGGWICPEGCGYVQMWANAFMATRQSVEVDPGIYAVGGDRQERCDCPVPDPFPANDYCRACGQRLRENAEPPMTCGPCGQTFSGVDFFDHTCPETADVPMSDTKGQPADLPHDFVPSVGTDECGRCGEKHGPQPADPLERP